MFGYVRPVKPELRMRDYDRYHAAYCGVCRALGRNFGFFSRFLVNYDMTFLYLLLASVRAPQPVEHCHCPARLGCKKACITDAELFRYVAAVDVILCRHKLRDDIHDSGFWKRIAYRAVRLVTARGYRRAKAALPVFDDAVQEKLGRLSALEQAQSDSIDRTADAFAAILSDCAALYEEDELRRPLEQLLYHVGRFIYLTDALDDLAEDCKTGNYNPLRYRFQPESGKLNDEDTQYLKDILNGSVNLAGAAFELLPLKSGRELLENIIYLGLPSVLKCVLDGSFHEKAKI